MTPMTTQCCIAGGGPAGMMLGLLLARAGVRVVVLEKHADFLRDFRGDTVHPSTLEVMYELGYIDEFLELPHQKMRFIVAQFGETRLRFADFSHLPLHCKFVGLMPQWDFLNFLAEKAAGYPGFSLMMRAEATGLIERDGKVSGVSAQTPSGPLEVSEGETTLIAPPVAGRLVERSVSRGETIAKDAVVFSLDPTTAEAEVARSRALVAESKARLADLRTGKREAEQDVVRAQRREAEALLRLAEKELARTTPLVSTGYTSRARHDQTASQVAQMRARSKPRFSRSAPIPRSTDNERSRRSRTCSFT